MAAISLREYIQKIENLIENNEIDQAIAHCKHILKIYPKHIDSYRLLGKAFLEKQKFSDASDIFQRVISSIPDDFISHIGMSIIREDENNLDASIWHMERAFEVQPSNKAVQDELRRLYTNRDGVAPPKIRLTRGALVRMYVRGELNEQAIGEINAALEEDPNRIDLEVILAKIYFNMGQKVEATETCSKIITRLPYCFDANKILTEILPGTTREEDQKIFRQRVIDLDPYFEFTNKNLKDSSEISDDKIMVDYLDWDPLSDVYDQPDWAKSIGLSVDNENSLDNDISFWLSDSEKDSSNRENEEFINEDTPKDSDNSEDVEDMSYDEATRGSSDSEVIAPEGFTDSEGVEAEETEIMGETDQESHSDELQADSKDEITSEGNNLETNEDGLPEWLRDAGWEKSTDEDPEIQKGYSIPPLSDETQEEDLEKDDLDSVEPGDIPDWIKEIAPTSDLLEGNKISQEDEFEFKNLEDLISDFDTEETSSITDEKLSTWESEFDDATTPASTNDENEIKDEGVEEILSNIQFMKDSNIKNTDEEEEENDGEEDNLDWLKSISLDESQIDASQETSPSKEFNLDFDKMPENETETNDQLIPQEEENSEWLNSILENEEEKDLEDVQPDNITSDDFDESEKEIPDWIKSVVEEDVEEEVEETKEFENEAEEDHLESYSFSEEKQDEQEDEFTISFDETDEFPEQEDQPLEEPVVVENSEHGESEDDLEEKLADQALSELENELIAEIEETPSFQQDEDLPEFLEDTEDTTLSSKDKKEDIETTIAWMEGLGSSQAQKSDEDPSKNQETEEAKDIEPEWISELVDSSEPDLSDLDTTPSWLRDLEIETEGVDNKSSIPDIPVEEETISENLTESINELDEVNEDVDDQEVPDLSEEVTDFDLETNVEETSIELDSSLVEGEQPLTDQLEQKFPDQDIHNDEVEMDLDQESELIPDSAVEEDEPELTTTAVLEEVEAEPSTAGDLEDEFDDDLVIEVEESEETTEGESLQEFEPEFDTVEETAPSDADLQLETDIESDEPSIEIVPAEAEFTQADEITKEQGDELPSVEDTSKSMNDLEVAKKLLESGEIDQSINAFNDLIKDNLFLEDIISDIQNALDHHYPIDIDLWKTLGDAHLKNKELQKALDSYSKAEDLLS